MSHEVLVAIVAATPPTLAAVLAFTSTRSVKRSLGPTNGVPISRMVEILDGKIDRQFRDLVRLGERQARLEERLGWHLADHRQPLP